MDTPRAAVVHKKNVHIGGGNATVTMKPDSLKAAKIAGKERKALENLRSTYLPAVGASKDVNLKQKSTRKGTAVVHKKNVHIGGGNATVTMKPDSLNTAKIAGKKRKALENLRSTYLPVVGASKDVNLKQKSTRKENEVKKNQMTQGKHSKSVLQGFGKGNKPLDHIIVEEIKQCSVWAPFLDIFTEEEIKQCYEWAKDGVDGIGDIEETANIFKHSGCGRSSEYATNLFKKKIPGSEFEEPFTEEPFTSEEKGYETDEPEFKTSVPVFVPSGLWVEGDYQLPEEVELNDDY